jgi:predicted nucleotidyltransferase
MPISYWRQTRLTVTSCSGLQHLRQDKGWIERRGWQSDWRGGAMPTEPPELAELLDLLLDASVEFILVGGGAAVIHGAPVTTQDVDIVHSRQPANVDRLMQVLSRLDARVIDPAGRDLKPERAALAGTGQSLLRTRLGRIDALGALHDGRGYEELLANTDTVDFDGRSLRIVDLQTLIEIKSGTGRAKDRLVVPILLALARQRSDEGGD